MHEHWRENAERRKRTADETTTKGSTNDPTP
jgi:hypothetical protein